MKKVFDPKLKWFYKVNVWLDLGFQGAEKDYGGNSKINLPHKRQRKSKKTPKPKLTAAQIKHNRNHAKTRVPVEHAIGGMKAFHCLTHRIRNHLDPIIRHYQKLSQWSRRCWIGKWFLIMSIAHPPIMQSTA